LKAKQTRRRAEGRDAKKQRRSTNDAKKKRDDVRRTTRKQRAEPSRSRDDERAGNAAFGKALSDVDATNFNFIYLIL